MKAEREKERQAKGNRVHGEQSIVVISGEREREIKKEEAFLLSLSTISHFEDLDG